MLNMSYLAQNFIQEVNNPADLQPNCFSSQQSFLLNLSYLKCKWNEPTFQLNATTTVFLGGYNDPVAIKTLDWNTLEYTVHNEELINEHQYGACALARGPRGEPLVAFASGTTAGLEIWDPESGTVTNVSPDFPPISGDVQSPKLVAVKGGSELIYYETGTTEVAKPIYKYFVANNTWLRVGDMLVGRDDFFALPVRDITCQALLSETF